MSAIQMRVSRSDAAITPGWLRPAALPILVGILLITLALYLPPYLDSFLGDDFVQQWRIRDLVAEPGSALQVFQPDWTDWYYRPLQNLWMLLNRLLFGLAPAASYFLQGCLHLLGISLIYRVSRGFGIGRLGALIAASLFAINIEHHLTVDWISSIGVVAASTLSLGAVAIFNRYLKPSPNIIYLALTFVLWLAALFFHETAILLPLFLFIVWLSYPDRTEPSLSLLILTILMGIVMSLFVLVQFIRVNANISSESLLAFNGSAPEQLVNFGQFLIRLSSCWLGLKNHDLEILNHSG
ncbi:MAG: hypothetical protein ACK2T3_14335, partial [Candidatus Promineifilaceae bacterium]